VGIGKRSNWVVIHQDDGVLDRSWRSRGITPCKRRHVLVISDDQLNANESSTVIVAAMTGNTMFKDMPGNVLINKGAASLPSDSVVNVSGIATINKSELGKHIGAVPDSIVRAVDAGFRLSIIL
jgi:mRNA interferase MazF